ncbi:programmed cell death protein 2-like [Pholidichthys leucotaenia]
MASHRQDSVLIGVHDGPVDPRRHRTSFQNNKVGGAPDWPPLLGPSSPLCGVCGAPSAHVVQVYCPLEGSPYHRTLHLFACRAVGCSGRPESWTALRSQSLEAEAEAPGRRSGPQEPPARVTDWCDSADDWGTEEEDDGWGSGGVTQEEETAAPGGGGVEMDVSSHLQDLRLAESLDTGAAFCPFFISVVEESDLCDEDDGDMDHARVLLQEYQRREGTAVGDFEGSGCDGGGGEEKYEKTRARHGDAVFSRFMKRISACPQQVLRYCRAGKPLFMSEPPSNMAQLVTACSACGGLRTFELQLMPALVSLLQRRDGGEGAELEFGTVLVYTCAKSCWASGLKSPLEEFCFVQADPDQQLFK